MPKTLEGINAGPFKKTTLVPQPGEQRIAANVEVPVQDLLNNAAYLLRLIAELTSNLEGHTHAIATDTAAGFMAPGDRRQINELLAAIQNHSHSIATTAASGFMSSADKKKLNEIEDGAHKVTAARVENALGVRYGSVVLPGSTIGGNQVKTYRITMPGVKTDDCAALSESVPSAAQFLLGHRTRDGAVEIYVKNLFGDSRTFEGGEVRVVVFSSH